MPSSPPAALRLVRLENRSAGAEKTYEVSVEPDPAVAGGHLCRARWGRISASHRSEQVKHRGPAATCESVLGRLVREKRSRGYQVVEDRRGEVRSAAPPARSDREVEPPALSDLLAKRRREATWTL